MNIEELLHAGNDILEDVVQAVNTNEYSGLGQRIGARVKDALQESVAQQQAWSSAGTAGRARTRQSHFLLRRVGRGGSTAKTVLGGLGLLVFGIPAVVFLAGLLMGGDTVMAAGLGIFGILAAGAGWLLRSGIRGTRLVDRYYAYGRRLADAEYVSIPELAQSLGKKEQEVRKDLLAMMQKGYLPQARMDAQQKTLILTDRAYSLYQQAENSRVQRTAEEAAKKAAAETAQKKQEAEQKARQAEPREKKEIREILERGNAYIRKVRDVNDVIPDTEEMSTKLYRLEEIMHRIFEQVQKQPESAAGLRRFMDYYLPTTEKLLDAYVELDKQPVSGENITKTKQEIDEALDVINDAFENLLNGMFESMAWDISSDISVMKTMLAQDGLTKERPLYGYELTKEAEKAAEKEPVPR